MVDTRNIKKNILLMNAHNIQVNPYKAYKSLDIKNHNIDIAMKLNRCDNNTFSHKFSHIQFHIGNRFRL